MAPRDLSTFNRVTNATPDASAASMGAMAQTVGDVAGQIFKASQDAKITQNLSKAQLDLNALDMQYRKDSEADPFNKQLEMDYKESRNSILSTYGDEISPFYRRHWQENAQRLTAQSDISNQAWQYKQAYSNTITGVNDGIKNNLEAAAQNGRLYASGQIDDLETMLNYAPTRANLEEFARTNLGDQTTQEMLKTYDEDYLRSFLSGVAEDNPVRALELMESDVIREGVGDSATFNEFKDAIENRALKVQEINIKRDIITNMKAEGDLFTSGKPLSYAQMKMATANMSKPAQEYFMRANGYAKEMRGEGKKQKMDNVQKEIYKASLVDDLNRLTRQEEITPDQVQELQGKIFNGMNNKSITRKEGAQLMEQLVAPALEGMEESLSDFTSGNWNPFAADVGLSEVMDYYDDRVAIPGDDKELGDVSRAINATNKVNLFSYYQDALRTEAERISTPNNPLRVGDLKSLDWARRRQIYKAAAAEAINNFKADNVPSMIKGDIPMAKVKLLIDNPDKAGDFDALFGTGAANRILGR